MTDNHSPFDPAPPLPPEFERLHHRLAEAGEDWRAGLPSTEPLEAYFQALAQEEPMARRAAQPLRRGTSDGGSWMRGRKPIPSLFQGRVKLVTAEVALVAVIALFAVLFSNVAGFGEGGSAPGTAGVSPTTPATGATPLPSSTITASPTTPTTPATTATPLPSSTAAPPINPQLVSHSASVRVQGNQPTSVSASCQPGEQMIGGGFAASNLFEYAASIEASYPSGAATWTVTGAAPTSYFDLTAQVYCVSAPVSLGVQIVQGASGGQVTCPNGTSLLGGGFQGTQPVAASYPVQKGWSSPSSDHVYVLCASQHVTADPVVKFVFNAHSSSSGYHPGYGSANCPAGQFAAGGGFTSQGDVIVSSTLGGPPFTGWSVGAGGDANVTGYILCAALKG